MLTKVIKRDGSIEEFIPHKLNKWGEWAAEKLGDRANWSEVVLEAMNGLKDQCTTAELQNHLIKACVDKQDWPHSLMAGRLYIATIHKQIYGDRMPSIKELHIKLINLGLMVDLGYSDEELELANNYIDHTRDFNLAYFQVDHIMHKYVLQDRVNKIKYETPQFADMRVALALSKYEPLETRMAMVKKRYDFYSTERLNNPTPSYINLGTKNNGRASCCLYVTNDDVMSLAVGDHIALIMTAESAGIGGLINTRAPGDPVRGGFTQHRGKLPYYKSVAGAVNANTQGGRGGACTQHYSAFDPEAITIAQLQNPMAPEDKKNRDIHFAMMGNRLLAKKVANNEDIFQFTSFSHPDLWELFFSGDKDAFEELYNKYENDDSPKTYINARKFVILAIQQSYEVGTHYLAFMDEINRHTPFNEPIHSSNLCVAPETRILTTDGYVTISENIDKTVNVWNGIEFSETVVRKTSDNSLVIDVVTEEGYTLPCTEYHKFHINNIRRSPAVVERKASQLSAGMKTIDFDLPFLTGSKTLSNSYINGFYSGSGYGTPEGARITLYGNMSSLLSVFKDSTQWKFDSNSCYTHFDNLEDKYFIPSNDYTVESRLNWLGGLADSSGFIMDKDGEQSLVITSLSRSFLTNTGLMLQTLGVLGRISDFTDINEVTRRNFDYQSLPAKALTIDHNSLQFLLDKGLEFKHHKVEKTGVDLSKLSVHLTIKEVINKGRMVETYCFTEPNRNMGMFNGMLAGNCMEITSPTSPYMKIEDLYKAEDNGHITYQNFQDETRTLAYSSRVVLENGDYTFAGNLKEGTDVKKIISVEPTSEVGICSLASIPVCNITSDEEYAEVAYIALKDISSNILNASYKLPHIGYTAKNRMNAGVGIIGLAYQLAKEGIKYNSQEGFNRIHEIAERHAYFVIKASLRIAKEIGNAPWIHKTKWPKGWLPIDTYKNTVDTLVTVGLKYDWETLRKEIIIQGGIAHSSLIAHMPTESSSKRAGLPNGPYPTRGLELKKEDQTNVIEWVAIDGDILKDQYQLAWDIPTMDMIKIYSIIQKFTDQSISADTYADRTKDLNVYTKDICSEYVAMCKYGMKSRYYANSKTSRKDKTTSILVTDSNEAKNTDEGVIGIDTTAFRRGECVSGVCDV